MPARRVPPTRHALLRTNERLERTRRALTVLERRRDGLVVLMRSLLAQWRTQDERVEAAFADAESTRTLALEREGVVALKAAAEAREDHAELLLATQRLQGLPVPLILVRGVAKRLDERGYGILGTSAAIDETADAHETVLGLVVRQAELETALRIVLLTIRRTNVRVNALRYRVVPDLEATRAYIEFHLAEREREERLVQRFFKRKREARRRRAGRGPGHPHGEAGGPDLARPAPIGPAPARRR